MRLLADAYPDDQDRRRRRSAAARSRSIIPTGLKAQEYLKDIGIKVAVLQNQPVQVDNYRPYVEQWKQSGAAGIYQISAQDPTPIVQAMKNVGYNPAWILYSTQFYGPQAAAAAKALGSFPPSYVQFTAIPFDLANKYPVRAAAHRHRPRRRAEREADDLHALVDERLAAVGEVGQGVRVEPHGRLRPAARRRARRPGTPAACTRRRTCGPATSHASPCIAMVKLDQQRFAYDEKLTQPTTGKEPFNCDAEQRQDGQDLHPDLVRGLSRTGPANGWDLATVARSCR